MARTIQTARLTAPADYKSAVVNKWHRLKVNKIKHAKPTSVLRETRKLKKSLGLVLPVLPFRSIVHKAAASVAPGFHIQPDAFKALQKAGEEALVKLFQESNVVRKHAKHVSLTERDMKIARRMCGDLI